MQDSIQHPDEPKSNVARRAMAKIEPRSQRTYTPSLGVFSRAAGSYVWTLEDRPLYDFTSGVLVANLGHHPREWLNRLFRSMGWDDANDRSLPYPKLVPLTSYNAVTEVETQAVEALLAYLNRCSGGGHFDQVLWAASGSEAIQKALWIALAVRPHRSIILATRHGFHGKKGLAGAVSGTEQDKDRDPRVHFVPFPMEECRDIDLVSEAMNLKPFWDELAKLVQKYPGQIAALITEPYLGAAGSYHPPASYLRMLQRFCQEHGIIFILDEIQSNFGRTGRPFAFEHYGLRPDLLVLGKGLGNGVPVAAVVGPETLMNSMPHGAGSDTYSGHPLGCAAVMATVACFQSADILAHVSKLNKIMVHGLHVLRQLPFVKHIRGEVRGMVWGIELSAYGNRSAEDMAKACVLEAYRGETPSGQGIHLLGPLAGKVIRIAPPYSLSEAEAQASCELLERLFRRLVSG